MDANRDGTEGRSLWGALVVAGFSTKKVDLKMLKLKRNVLDHGFNS